MAYIDIDDQQFDAEDTLGSDERITLSQVERAARYFWVSEKPGEARDEQREAKQSKHIMKEYIRQHKIASAADKAYWDVFSVAIGGRLEQDMRTGKVFLRGVDKPMTQVSLQLLFDRILGISSSRIPGDYSSARFQELLEHRQVNFIKRKLQELSDRFPKDFPEWDSLASRVLKVDDELSQAMFTSTHIGAVRRALKPGCNHKRMFVLKGSNDARKSTFVKVMADLDGMVKHDFDEVPELYGEIKQASNSADFGRTLKTAWIAEWSEIDKHLISKSASEAKDLVSAIRDEWNPKYIEDNRRQARASILVGTTNADQFFKDESMLTRLWTVIIPDDEVIDTTYYAQNIQHIWATAYRRYLASLEAGDMAWELKPALQSQSDARSRMFILEGTYNEAVDTILSDLAIELKVSEGQTLAFRMTDLLAFMKLPVEKRSMVQYALKQLGYETRSVRVNGKVAKLWAMKAKEPIVTVIQGGYWTLADKKPV